MYVCRVLVNGIFTFGLSRIALFCCCCFSTPWRERSFLLYEYHSVFEEEEDELSYVYIHTYIHSVHGREREREAERWIVLLVHVFWIGKKNTNSSEISAHLLNQNPATHTSRNRQTDRFRLNRFGLFPNQTGLGVSKLESDWFLNRFSQAE